MEQCQHDSNVANTKYKVEWDILPSFGSNGGQPMSTGHVNSLGYGDGYDGSPYVNEASSPGDELKYVIDGLDQGTTYYIRITARNSLGYGTPTSTLASVPMKSASAPTNVALSALSTEDVNDTAKLGTSLLVDFSTPSDMGGDTASAYRIEWSSTPWSEFRREVQRIETSIDSGTVGGNFRLQLDTSLCATCMVQGVYVTARIQAAALEQDVRRSLVLQCW